MPEADRVHGDIAAHRDRKAAEVQAAGAVLGRPRPSGQLEIAPAAIAQSFADGTGTGIACEVVAVLGRGLAVESSAFRAFSAALRSKKCANLRQHDAAPNRAGALRQETKPAC